MKLWTRQTSMKRSKKKWMISKRNFKSKDNSNSLEKSLEYISFESIPDGAKRIIEKLNESGYSAYIVGGCVRDMMLFRTPNDWDICTSAKPEEVMGIFGAKNQNANVDGVDAALDESEMNYSYNAQIRYKVIPTGQKHGTVTVLVYDSAEGSGATDAIPEVPGFEPYEVTTFRVDGAYTDSRHPDSVKFVSSVEEDLARRDFTINAMALSHDGGHAGLMDPFGGMKDLEKGIIRCVGDPEKRFSEDALRILRCIRFAAQLDFEIEEKTAAAMTKLAPLLDNIAAERIRVEFDKLLCGKGALKVLKTHRQVIAQFIPEAAAMFDLDQENPFHLYDVWMHTLHAVDSIPPEPVLRLAAFFHDIGKPPCKVVADGWGHFYGHEKTGADMTNEIMHRLKYDNATRHTVVRLIDKHGIVFNPTGKQAGRLLHKLGEADLRRLIQLERADVSAQHPDYVKERLENIDAFEKKVDDLIAADQVFQMRDLAIDGHELIKIGIIEGKAIGKIKSLLLEKVIDGELENERDALIKEAKKMCEAASTNI